jgi:hypothetical protein
MHIFAAECPEVFGGDVGLAEIVQRLGACPLAPAAWAATASEPSGSGFAARISFENRKHNTTFEWASRKLDPQLDMRSTAEPVVAGIADNLGPVCRLDDLSRGPSFSPPSSPTLRGARLAERLYNHPSQSRTANTTNVVIEFH